MPEPARASAGATLRALALQQARALVEARPPLPDWANDGILPRFVVAAALQRRRCGEDWYWCAPRLIVTACGEVAGSASFKASPVEGQVEIGYGVAPGYRRRGLATAAVGLMLAEAFTRHEVAAVLAETAEENRPSQRVLEANGFARTGLREDRTEGRLILWRRARA